MSDAQRSNLIYVMILALLGTTTLTYIMGATLLLAVMAGIGGALLVACGAMAATEEYGE